LTHLQCLDVRVHVAAPEHMVELCPGRPFSPDGVAAVALL
jgi:hypothetical protein